MGNKEKDPKNLEWSKKGRKLTSRNHRSGNERDAIKDQGTFSHTDARIWKLWDKGLSVQVIARKIGRPADIERVVVGLERIGVTDQEMTDRRIIEKIREAFKLV